MNGDEFRRRFAEAFEDADPGDVALVDEVTRTLDQIAALDADVAEHGLQVQGARGSVTNPSLVEARHQRALLTRLLRELRVSLDDEPQTNSQRGRRAAMKRWAS